jgi:hypothetical protein
MEEVSAEEPDLDTCKLRGAAAGEVPVLVFASDESRLRDCDCGTAVAYATSRLGFLGA